MPRRARLPLYARNRRRGVSQLSGRADPARWRKLGVLVEPIREARQFSEDEIYGLEVVAMVLAEMAELASFFAPIRRMPLAHAFRSCSRHHRARGPPRAASGCMSCASSSNPWRRPAEGKGPPERGRGDVATTVDLMLSGSDDRGRAIPPGDGTYRLFAHSSWLRRMEEAIDLGLSAEAAVEKEQGQARARLESAADPYLRDRLHDLDDCRTGFAHPDRGGRYRRRDAGNPTRRPQYRARRAAGHGRRRRAWCWRKARSGSHAIVARALAIPLVIHADRHRRGAERRPDSWSMAIRASSICAPRKASPSPSATRWPCRPRRKTLCRAARPARHRQGGTTIQLT